MIYTAVDTFDTFYLTDEQLKNSPSRRDGIDEATETTLRIYGCDLIQTSGILLTLPQAVMATGQVLFHRFYCKESFASFNVKRVAATCVWLASKLDQCPRKVGQVLIVFHRMECRRENLPIELLDTSSKKYADLKEDLIRIKRHLQKEMDFICHVEHPHKLISIYIATLELPFELRQEAWNLANDSLRTTLCVRFKCEVVACGVVYAAARRFQIPLPENPPWWKAFDADKADIDEVCRVLAHLYNLPKAHYIHVCKEVGSFSTSNRSWGLPSNPMPKVKNKKHRSCQPKKFSAAAAATWQGSSGDGSTLAERCTVKTDLSQPTLRPTSKPFSRPKTRGPTTLKKMKKKKFVEELSIEFDELNRPIGLHGKTFKSYVGTLVRSHVDINISDWPKVSQDLKNMIWEDIKRKFKISDDAKKQAVLRVAGMRWKDFKSRLLREFIKKKHPRYESPTQCYDFLTDAQWEKFVADRETEEFKEISRKAKEYQSLNKHPHFLGSAGYAGKKSEWLASDPLSSQSSCASVNSTLLPKDRSLDWVRARTKKGKDGKYYIPNEKTKEVFQKIVEKCEEVSQGSFQPKRQHDILSTVLGKGDHAGCVRGVGAYITIREVFGKPGKREGNLSAASVENLRQTIKKEVYSDIAEKVKKETISTMQPKIDFLNDQLNFIMKNMTQQILVDLNASTGTPQSLPSDPPPQTVPSDLPLTRSSCHSIDMNLLSTTQHPTQSAPSDPPLTHSSCHSVDMNLLSTIQHPTQSVPSDPPLTHSSCHSILMNLLSTVQQPTPCRLALCPIGVSLVVARGMVYPTRPNTVVHNQPLLPNHVKVLVDEVVEGAEEFILPVQTHHQTNVGDAVKSFTQWPTHLVLMGEDDIVVNSEKQNEGRSDILINSEKQNEGRSEQSGEYGELSPIKARSPLVDDDVLQNKEMTQRSEQSGEYGELFPIKARSPLVDDDVLQHLGNECKQLVALLKSMPLDMDYFELELDYAIFHHRNVNAIFVMMDNIKDLLTMKWLDVSIIQVFILCLNRLRKQNGVNSIGFLCPTQISKANVLLNVDVVTTYLAHAMLQLKNQRFILAPYHQEHHWLLLVISVSSKTVYVLDPIECERTLEIKPALNMVFRSFTNQRGQRARNMVDWKKVHCSQQLGSVECGYHVMRYMYEMCTKYSDYTILDEAFQEAKAYSKEEIDEMRNMWAKYFMEECV